MSSFEELPVDSQDYVPRYRAMLYAFRLAIFALAFSCAACANLVEGSAGRGKLTYASTNYEISLFERLSEDRVTGKACFNPILLSAEADDPIFERALASALQSVPAATVLVDVELVDTGSCFKISGIPARVN
jgi:hypothetical protein